MIGKMKKSTVVLIALGAVAAVILAMVLVAELNSGQKSFSFFYPDKEYRKLSRESRSIRVKDKTGSPLELKLLKEYVLGPVHYSLKLVIGDDILVKNVWSVQDGTLFVNFNEGFEKYLRNNNADSRWFIAGLVETLKENTSYKRLIILINNNQINETAGEFRLGQPIAIRG